MSSQVPDQSLGDAILQSVEHGTFPQSEHVVSAPVSSSALPKLLEIVGQAREDTKNEVRKSSQEAGPDVDGWISQARKLQNDLKRSQATAHEIVQQAEAGKETTSRVQDAAAKVSFLYSEIAYNEDLVKVVEQLRDIRTLVEAVQDAAVQGNVMHALERLEDANAAFKQLGTFEHTRAVGVLKARAGQLRADIVENVAESWSGLIVVDSDERCIILKEEVGKDGATQIQGIVDAFKQLDLLNDYISRLSRDFDNIILTPRLVRGPDHLVAGLNVDGDMIQSKGYTDDKSVKATLEDIQSMIDYLSTRIPPSVAVPLSDKLVPVIANRLIANWLLPAVPLTTEGVDEFQESLSLVLGLAEYMDELEWSGQDRLREWVDKSAEIWLARQKEEAILQVQDLCPKRVREKKTVERVETQTVVKGDALHDGQEEQDEDWGADWEDEEETSKESQASPEQRQPPPVEEEDMSAWDDGDEGQEQPWPANDLPEKAEHGEEDAEAWGWGEEEEAPSKPPEQSPVPAKQLPANGKATASQKSAAEQQVTLREVYTVTAIPDAVMEIIIQVMANVRTLNEGDLAKSAIAPASGGLFVIPSLLMAMYRATAAAHYSKDVAGNMLIYNDCTRLSDRLRTYLQEQVETDKSSSLPAHLRPSLRLNLDEDLGSIEMFGKRAYGREMESQRTIVRDLLDGAQGFQTCTAQPFATECDNAIAMTIDRIEEVKRQWQNVLSHSALLQSLGSLVSTALTKFIDDIQELADIAEDESRKLHSYCVSLASLSSLFQTENGAGEPQDMTSIYTPNWFKFQYLSEILDSSLADIRYFWTDGELKLEMEAQEVVDLIKALFAESDYRHKAIAEIRRTTLRRFNLSQLVNNLLHNEKAIPFEFLVNGQFLRSSIEEFLTQNGISAETTLNVEYTRALIPPLNVSSFEHDDWVSSVDILSQTSPAGSWSKDGIQSGQERILSASYDGLVRVWNLSGDCIATSPPPNNGGRITSLKSAKWISATRLVAAGLDNVVRVYKYDEDERTITSTLELYNHRWGVEDIAVHGPSNRILSASSDTTISLFSSNAKENPTAPSNLLPTSTAASNKRQKLSKPDRTVPSRGALSTLSGHTSPVSSVIFKPDDATVAYSASHDHTLRTWDLPTSTCVDTRTTGHSLLSLAALPSRNLLATGTSARHITLIDPRTSATQIAIMTLRGHGNGVVSLDTDPTSEYGLVSGSHDGTVKIWDIRSKQYASAPGEGQVGESVYSFDREGAVKMRSHGEGVKVFGVRWEQEVGIVSAGEDKKVQINRSR
ncbi:hypothetical protein K491DRAFT_595152 [Lophiostoma macrostomum CBS 122681]|uniref:Ribosome biogenesis protein YTM1 n=1 Tax=Lophiostoma macrostomum CBS 122681 TaxID=1314788 RepID=A0A6A6TBH2_9PLEO|nr:hypothetical protein K491DRAFT_595152 [Lophiostoma macrostomum CBS 122681]